MPDAPLSQPRATRPLPSPATVDRSTPTVIGTITTLLHYRYLIVGIPFVVGLLIVIMRFAGGSTYIATSRFTPEGGNNSISRLAGLASQFGVALPQAGDRESLEFYAELIKSEDLLRSVVTSHYHVGASNPRDTVGPTLVDIYEVGGTTDEERQRRAITLLRLKLNVLMDLKANVITVVVSAKDPVLAVQINRRILDAMNRFNVQKRQSRAAAERAFVEARLRDALRALNEAETASKNFLESNRQYRGSPALVVEEARLQRQVDMRQQLYNSLSQTYEQARIEEVRNIPVFTVIDQPEGSARTNNRLLLRLLLALAPAFALALALAFAHDYLRRQREENPEEYARFAEARRRMVPGRRRAADRSS